MDPQGCQKPPPFSLRNVQMDAGGFFEQETAGKEGHGQKQIADGLKEQDVDGGRCFQALQVQCRSGNDHGRSLACLFFLRPMHRDGRCQKRPEGKPISPRNRPRGFAPA